MLPTGQERSEGKTYPSPQSSHASISLTLRVIEGKTNTAITKDPE